MIIVSDTSALDNLAIVEIHSDSTLRSIQNPRITMQLTITLTPELEQKLATQAARLNIPLEHLVLQSLEQTAQQADQLDNDPLIALFGSFRSDVPDLADNHDHYIGQALYQEMNRAE